METIFISDFNHSLFVSCFKNALTEFSVDTTQLNRHIADFNSAGNIFAFVLVNEHGEAIGMIQFQKTELSNQYIKEEYGLIREFWVAPEYRKRGWGIFLLQKAEGYFNTRGRFLVLNRQKTF